MSPLEYEVALVAASVIDKSELPVDSNVVVVTDTVRPSFVPEAFMTAAGAAGLDPVLVKFPTRKKILTDPPGTAVAAMVAADLVIDCTTQGWVYAPAMAEILESGTRLLSVGQPERIVKRPPSEEVISRAAMVRDLIGDATTMRITTTEGTDIRWMRGDRPLHVSDGVATDPGEFDGLGTGLVAFAPVEDSGSGVLRFKGSLFLPMDEFHIVDEPLSMTIEDGRIVNIDNSALGVHFQRWMQAWNDPAAYTVAHVGFGLDHRAGMSASDPGASESLFGGAHIAFGANTGPVFLGMNESKAHCDLVVVESSVWFDDTVVLEGGKFVLGQESRDG